MKFVIEHTFARVALPRFVEIYFSNEFNDAVAPVAGLKERRLVEERRREDGLVERRVRLVPDVPIPAAFERLLAGRKLTYDEVGLYDPSGQVVRYRIDHKAGERLQVSGVIRFVEVEGGVKRVIEGDVEVAIFGVGPLVERFIETEVRKGYDKIAAFMQRYIDEHPAG